jgi:methionine--tRNA ligase beta chain
VNTIAFDDFVKVDLRVATILAAEVHPKADKLVVLQVELGEEKRQIVAGIRAHYDVAQLAGRQIIVVANLEPRELRGVMSHGMLLAAKDDASFALLTTDKPVKSGTQAG